MLRIYKDDTKDLGAKNPPNKAGNAGDVGLIPGEENGNPL